MTLIDTDRTQNYNNLYQNLPTTKYAIYGLSSFELSDTSACSTFNIDLSINTANSYTLVADNTDYLTSVFFQADIFTANNNNLCNNGAEFTTLNEVKILPLLNPLLSARLDNIDNLLYFKERVSEEYATIPSNNVQQTISQIDDNPLNVEFEVKGVTDDATNVILTATIVMQGTTVGKGYGIRTDITPSSTDNAPTTNLFHTATDGSDYSFELEVDGNTIFDFDYTAAELKASADSADVD